MIDPICERLLEMYAYYICDHVSVFDVLKSSEILPLPKKTRKLGSAFRSLYPTHDHDDNVHDPERSIFLTERQYYANYHLYRPRW